MEQKKLKWVKPKLIEMGALPSALGHCLGGNTETGATCVNGALTAVSGTAHLCSTGGAAGTCTTGGNTT